MQINSINKNSSLQGFSYKKRTLTQNMYHTQRNQLHDNSIAFGLSIKNNQLSLPAIFKKLSWLLTGGECEMNLEGISRKCINSYNKEGKLLVQKLYLHNGNLEELRIVSPKTGYYHKIISYQDGLPVETTRFDSSNGNIIKTIIHKKSVIENPSALVLPSNEALEAV